MSGHGLEEGIKVLLVDDHPLVRDGIRSRIEADPALSVVGEAGTAQEALDLASSLHPDIVLMDISMPGMSGIEAVTVFRKQVPHIKILMLSMHDSKEYVVSVLENGAKGYILKDVASEEMILAVKTVYEGRTYYSSGVTDLLLDHNKAESYVVPLTDREKTILKLLAQGNSNKHVARDLEISVRTVETHRRNIKRKLDVKNSAGLVKYALEYGLISV